MVATIITIIYRRFLDNGIWVDVRYCSGSQPFFFETLLHLYKASRALYNHTHLVYMSTQMMCYNLELKEWTYGCGKSPTGEISIAYPLLLNYFTWI